MKKYLAIGLVMASFGLQTAYADILPPGEKVVQVCAYFNNTAEMLDTLAVWGYETAPGGDKVDLSMFIANECFGPSYKFNVYNIYGVTAEHAAEIDADTYNHATDPEAYLPNIQLEMGMLYVDQDSDLTRAENEYHIIGLDEDSHKLVLEPVRTKKYYGDSETPTIVEGTVTSLSGTDNDPITGEMVFSDVDSDSPYYDALKYLKDNGIVSGYPDGSFKPDKTINRAEFVKIVSGSIATEKELNNCSAHYANQADYMLTLFTDVTFAMVGGNAPEWYFDYVCIGKLNGFIGGYPDGSFRPANEINFVEAAKIVVEASVIETAASDPWYARYVNLLADRGAIPTSITAFDQKITRGQMAEIMYRLRAKITDLPSQSYADLK